MACFVLLRPFYPLFDREPLCGVSLDRVMQRNLNEFDMVCTLWSSPLVSDGKEQNFFLNTALNNEQHVHRFSLFLSRERSFI